MTLKFQLYWSFRSPYSYLVTPRLIAFERAFDVACEVRVVYPTAIRAPEFIESRHPHWLSYFIRDMVRSAEYLGMELAWPRPDPVASDPQTGHYLAEQPYIHRLTRLGQAAAEQGQGLAFLHEVSKVLWSPAIANWTEGAHLHDAAARAGLDLDALDAAIAANPAPYEDAIQDNQRQLDAAGHWGVPLMVFEGEPFFGQDRFDMLQWRMAQKGLRRREAIAK